MAATTADEANALIAAAKCDLCYLPPGLEMYAILAALIDVANGGTVPDAQTLASEANCLLCYLTPGMVPYAILQAIRGITGGGTGSGGLSGSGSPEGVETANPGTTYWDATGKIFWVKDTGAGNTGWYRLVG